MRQVRLVATAATAALALSLVVGGGADAGEDIAAACPPEAVPAGAFEDAAGSAHAAAVDCAYWYGVVRGASTLRYAPAQHLRRDQMASVLARAVLTGGGSLPPAARSAFTDVDGNVHAGAIARLAEAGVVDGATTTTYAPSRPVRRDQMAAFVVRAYEHAAGRELPAGSHAFTDVAGNTHEDAIATALAAGLVAGTSARTYSPAATLRRDQAARFAARLLARLAALGQLEPGPRAFRGGARPLPADVRAFMTGRSWRPGCPVDLGALALIEATHRDLGGRERWGRMVVHADVAEQVVGVLRRLHDTGFPVERMRLVDHYGADDDASMADNNTSAFNCRRVTGGTSWSQHSFGTAVDVNPVRNPYVRGATVAPEAGRAYLDRTDVRPGMIVRPGQAVGAFDAIGWRWGGDWQGVKDYQHFER